MLNCCHPYAAPPTFEEAKIKAQAEANRTGTAYQVSIFNTIVAGGEKNEWTKEIYLPQPEDAPVH